MDWMCVDEGLVRRGEPLLSLAFIEGYDFELGAVNNGGVGRPFKPAKGYVEFSMVIRYLFSAPYRRIEGFIN
jgi:hypothetical protein